MPRHGPAEAALLRHLLSSQSGAAGNFPQETLFCGQLDTSDRLEFECRSFPRLSQPATLCAILAHFEICKHRVLDLNEGEF